jgi:FkbM family methyltransferase
VATESLISYAQNGADVVLLRTLGHVTDGRYVDVGAGDPVDMSLTKALYDRGWRGVDIDAVPAIALALREARPGNDVVQAAVSDRAGSHTPFFHLVDTGLSTLVEETARAHERRGYELREITVPLARLDDVCARSGVIEEELHLLRIDAEGAEEEVLRSFDLERWRPWVVVVESTEPLSDKPSHEAWDPLLTRAGYELRLFDGLSRFYSAPEHPELARALSYPACALDDYVPVRLHRQDLRVDELVADVEAARRETIRWRSEAVAYWANSVARVQKSEDEARRARGEAKIAESRLDKNRDQLQRLRAERKRLRLRVERLSARVRAGTDRPEPASPLRRRARAVARQLRRR